MDYTAGDPQFEVIGDVTYEVTVTMRVGDLNTSETFRLMVEIKPSMGDDFPAVLRQIRTQKERLDTLYAIHKSPFWCRRRRCVGAAKSVSTLAAVTRGIR